MASPYNSTDLSKDQSKNQMSSRPAGAGTQISKTAKVGAVTDANDLDIDTNDTIADHFDSDKAPGWEAAPESTKSSAQSKTAKSSASASRPAQTGAQRSQTERPQASQSLQPERPQRQSQPRQQMASDSGSGLDVLKGSLSGAFDQIVKEIEPQINDFASNFAHQAIAKGEDLGRQAIQRVQRQSWGRIAFAGALFIGAIAVLGYEAAEAASDLRSDSDSDLH